MEAIGGYCSLSGCTMSGTIRSSVAASADAFRCLNECEIQFPETKIYETAQSIVTSTPGGYLVAANGGLGLMLNDGSCILTVGGSLTCAASSYLPQLQNTQDIDTAGSVGVALIANEPDAVATQASVRVCNSSGTPTATGKLLTGSTTSCSATAQGTEVFYFRNNGALVLGNSATDGLGDLFLYGADLESLATNSQFTILSNADATAVTSSQPSIVFTAGTTIAAPLVAGDAIAGFGINGSTSGDNARVTTYGFQDVQRAATPNVTTGYTTLASGQIVHKVYEITLAETALTGASPEDETVITFNAKTRILRVIADVTQTFSGGGITDMDVTCGSAAGGNQYLISFDIDTATGTYGDVAAEIGASLLSATVADVPTWAGGGTMSCRFTCTGANCSAATQGAMTFYIEVVTYI